MWSVGTDDKRRTIVLGKETVVQRRGANWSFHLPDRHEIELTDDRGYVTLATPDQSSLFAVERIDDSDPEEVVVYLGEQHGEAGPPLYSDQVQPEILGYPLPEIQDEFERLHARWTEAGLSEQHFNAWPQGVGHEDQLRLLRRRLRVAEQPR
jgi:hypothetical protein